MRDQERHVAAIIRTAQQVTRYVTWPAHIPNHDAALANFEILALDEGSGDNSLSVLSVLHSQIPALRTLQDVRVGYAIGHATTLARGQVWLVLDHVIDPELGGWGVSQVLGGQRAAIVPGEILVVDRTVGCEVLRRFVGGLAGCQRVVMRHLRKSGAPLAYSPPPPTSTQTRARLWLRTTCSRIGVARFDRPTGR